jgi:hypothetical protein
MYPSQPYENLTNCCTTAFSQNLFFAPPQANFFVRPCDTSSLLPPAAFNTVEAQASLV